jgi:uncharacterized membrane protein YjfL (UPF0719 family)
LNKPRQAVTIFRYCTIPGGFHVRSGHQRSASLCQFFRDRHRAACGFLALYVLVTPYNELALIRRAIGCGSQPGRRALGFAMPIAVSVAVSHNLYAMIGWGVVAGASCNC